MNMLAIGFIAVALAVPALATECLEPQRDNTSFCVIYNKKVQNIESNECVLKEANITVLHQGLCSSIPNAQ